MRMLIEDPDELWYLDWTFGDSEVNFDHITPSECGTKIRIPMRIPMELYQGSAGRPRRGHGWLRRRDPAKETAAEGFIEIGNVLAWSVSGAVDDSLEGSVFDSDSGTLRVLTHGGDEVVAQVSAISLQVFVLPLAE